MGKVAIITDSNSGITQKQGKELGIYVVPMPFYIDEELFFEDITLTQEQFYEKLGEDADIKTSQPAPGDVMDLWDQILKEYDEIIHIPMSSGLSSSCATAQMLSEDYDGKVFVVDNQRISVTQRQSALDAFCYAKEGMSAEDIKRKLEQTKFDSRIYITVDSLKYLKKGGRVTPAAAAIGSVLNIKPVLQIRGEKLDAFAKTRGMKVAKKKMLAAVEADLKEFFPRGYTKDDVYIQSAYTGDVQEARAWAEEIQAKFPEIEFTQAPLSLSVACHIGEGALAIAWTKRY
ncbi:MAG: DegV family protein [Anaerostipes sp.]|nr:DegV family protein [Anaerostipes sp.]